MNGEINNRICEIQLELDMHDVYDYEKNQFIKYNEKQLR